jgi:hypothetical protein
MAALTRLWPLRKTHIHPETLAQTDTGYVGIKKIHSNSLLPKKKTKKKAMPTQHLEHSSNLHPGWI